MQKRTSIQKTKAKKCHSREEEKAEASTAQQTTTKQDANSQGPVPNSKTSRTEGLVQGTNGLQKDAEHFFPYNLRRPRRGGLGPLSESSRDRINAHQRPGTRDQKESARRKSRTI